MTITVDSRECGAGKTHKIHQNIQLHQSLNQRVLVALPSIHLVEQYAKEHPDACIITSKHTDNVQRALSAALNIDLNPVIICTQAALTEATVLSGTASTRHLIWDEAFEPWKEIEIRQSADDVIFDWNRHTTSKIDLDLTDYVSVNFDRLLTNNIMETHNTVRDLTNKNYQNWMSVGDYGKMVSDGAKRVIVIQELIPEFFTKWASVHIAAAAFENTYLRWWMQRHSIEYQIVLQMTQHKPRLTIHFPVVDDNGVSWSKNRKNTMTWVQDQFAEYVTQKTSGQPLLRLKNRRDNHSNFDMQELLPHNAAGLNGMEQYTHVSLESTLNPTAEFGAWLSAMTEFARPAITGKKEIDQAIYEGRTGYTFYQVLMRCSLRAGAPADCYVIDRRAVVALAYYFDNIRMMDIDMMPPADYQTKPAALTSAERNQAARLKKKYKDLYGKLGSREILTQYQSYEKL